MGEFMNQRVREIDAFLSDRLAPLSIPGDACLFAEVLPDRTGKVGDETFAKLSISLPALMHQLGLMANH